MDSGDAGDSHPKRLSVDLLDDFLRGQDYQRWNDAPVPIILFSDTMTKEQRREVFMPEYPILSVDLHERFDRNRNLAVKLLRESTLPCWQNREAMRGNMLNDAWYLIDIETAGLDRWKDRIIAIRVARMEWIPSGIILGLRMGVKEENLVVSMAREAGIKDIYKSIIDSKNRLNAILVTLK